MSDPMADLNQRLTTAALHVAEGRRSVVRQRARIAKLAALGASTLEAENTLDVFLRTLRVLEDYETLLREEFDEPTVGAMNASNDERGRVPPEPASSDLSH
jgi:hypothetical protein